MRTRIIIAIISLGFALTSAHADTNSWISTTDDFWDYESDWSLSVAPSINDDADLITNAASKTVTIDSTDTGSYQSTLTINNLTISGSAGTTNTLFLSNAGTNVPLRVLNALTIGSGGVLKITNSFLRVNESNSTFQVDGALQIFNGAKVQAQTITFGGGAVLQFALGTKSSTVAVSNDLTVAGTLNVINGGGFFTGNTYTLFTYGGALTNNGLVVGTTPNTNYTYTISTNLSGKVSLVVSGGPPPVAGFTASPMSGPPPLPVTFTDTSSGTITNWFWDFGDGAQTNFSAQTNPSHTYAAGTYTVTQTVSGPVGLNSSIQTNLITAQVESGFVQWQSNYFGCTDCPQAQPDADPLGKGMSNTNQFLAGFNPTNSAAYLHIISVTKSGNDMNITYLGASGDNTYSGGPSSRTNVLEFTSGTANGSYSNSFASAGVTNILSAGTGLGVQTNMVDAGGATNVPSRFYRVRVLVP